MTLNNFVIYIRLFFSKKLDWPSSQADEHQSLGMWTNWTGLEHDTTNISPYGGTLMEQTAELEKEKIMDQNRNIIDLKVCQNLTTLYANI